MVKEKQKDQQKIETWLSTSPTQVSHNSLKKTLVEVGPTIGSLVGCMWFWFKAWAIQNSHFQSLIPHKKNYTNIKRPYAQGYFYCLICNYCKWETRRPYQRQLWFNTPSLIQVPLPATLPKPRAELFYAHQMYGLPHSSIIFFFFRSIFWGRVSL